MLRSDAPTFGFHVRSGAEDEMKVGHSQFKKKKRKKRNLEHKEEA